MLYGMFRQRDISLRISRLNSPYVVTGCLGSTCDIFQPPGIVRSMLRSSWIVSIASTASASPFGGESV